MPCFYCNYKDTKLCTIDRVDSKETYKEDNIVPSCYICNMMKGVMDLNTFIYKCF